MNLLHAQNLHAAYRNHTVLHGINVALEAGEVLGIIGANGAGKTTLLRLLAGLYAPQKGGVMLGDMPLAQDAASARKLAYLEQNTQCHWPLEVEQLVALGRLPHLGFGQRLGNADREAIEQAMVEADVLHLRQRPATELSTGEQARVFLARALAVQPQVLLVDEPVAGLDPSHQLAVMELLQRKAAEGMGIVAVLHDLSLAARYCHRLLLLHEGSILASGTPQAVLTAENLRLALHVDAVMGEHNGVPFILPWQAT